MDKPTGGYKEALKKFQEEHSKNVQGKTDIKTVLIKDIADMKSALIKWTIIILIAACVFYFVYPKYYFQLPNNRLWKANKITGTVQVYKQSGWCEY